MKRSRAQHAAALGPSRTKFSQSRAKPGRRRTRRWAEAVPKPRNKTQGKKSAEPAPRQARSGQRSRLEGKPQRVFHIVFSHREKMRLGERTQGFDKTRICGQAGQRLLPGCNPRQQMSVFQELHENEEPHMHAAMQVSEPIRTPDCSGPCARSMEFLSTWKTAAGPTGALWRTWRCRPRASRTSTPARGLAPSARGGAAQRHSQRSSELRKRESSQVWQRHQAGQGAAPVHGQFVDYIVANKISDKSILYLHQRTSDKIEPVREFFFRHFKDIPTLLATVWHIQASTT